MDGSFVNFKKVMAEFAQEVTLASMRELGTRKVGKNRRYGDATGTLRRSLSHKIDGYKITWFVKPPADEYADFINAGVNGTQVNHDSPYSFKSKRPPAEAIMAWMKVKPVRLRDPKTGEFIKQTPERMLSAAIRIAGGIQRQGITPVPFFTNGFDSQVPKWEPKLWDALQEDIANQMENDLDNDAE